MHEEPTSGTNLSGRLGPRVPQRDVAQVAASEPIPIALRAVEPPNINQSALWTALVSRHTPPVVAKRVIDRIARGGNAHVLVPVVEDERALNADIAAYGVRIEKVSRTSLYKKPEEKPARKTSRRA
jgi:hypothetical protein